jgi:hypothetical protein
MASFSLHRYFCIYDDGINTREILGPLAAARDDSECVRICDDMNRELQQTFGGAFRLRFDTDISHRDFRRKVFLFRAPEQKRVF